MFIKNKQMVEGSRQAELRLEDIELMVSNSSCRFLSRTGSLDVHEHRSQPGCVPVPSTAIGAEARRLPEPCAVPLGTNICWLPRCNVVRDKILMSELPSSCPNKYISTAGAGPRGHYMH